MEKHVHFFLFQFSEFCNKVVAHLTINESLWTLCIHMYGRLKVCTVCAQVWWSVLVMSNVSGVNDVADQCTYHWECWRWLQVCLTCSVYWSLCVYSKHSNQHTSELLNKICSVTHPTRPQAPDLFQAHFQMQTLSSRQVNMIKYYQFIQKVLMLC